MRGQINFEFLISAALFLLAVGAVVINASSFIPDYSGSLSSASKHVEAKAITSSILTEPGRHSYGLGGPSWEKNESTRSSVVGVGVASEFHVLEMDKIQNLTSFETSGLNYTEFLRITGAENQYRFRFVWTPVIETPRQFQKNEPSQNPDGFNIETPETKEFSTAGDSVHYGNDTIDGSDIRLLVTSHNFTYDRVYFSEGDWNFTKEDDTTNKTVNEDISIGKSGFNFSVDRVQNRRKERGSAVYLSSQINTFGASPDSASSIVRMDRYAVLGGEPLRLETLVW